MALVPVEWLVLLSAIYLPGEHLGSESVPLCLNTFKVMLLPFRHRVRMSTCMISQEAGCTVGILCSASVALAFYVPKKKSAGLRRFPQGNVQCFQDLRVTWTLDYLPLDHGH